jgi:hypothetical protein
VKRGIFISFFVFLISITGVSAQDFQNSLWSSVHRDDKMKSFLMVEFKEGINCQITHAYLREGERTPFEWDRTDEEWYRIKDLIIIQDTWGEFIPLSIIDSSRLETKLGEQIIVLNRITPTEKDSLLEEFSLNGQ